MTILVISALISAIIVSIWYSKKKQKLLDEYQKQVKQYLNQLEGPQQQVTEEHYTFFFKVKDKCSNHEML